VPKLLTQEWLDVQTELGASLPERPGASATVQYTVTGAPGGDVVFHTVLENGRMVAGSLGPPVSADLAVIESYGDFVSILRDELDLEAAFMRGQVKITESGRLLTLLPLMASSEYKAAQVELVARTEWSQP
jgi:putative sterol carrier protein